MKEMVCTIMIFSFILVYPTNGWSQTERKMIDPRLEIVQKSYDSMLFFGLESGDQKLLKMAYEFIFESAKSQPAIDPEIIKLLPGEKLSEEQWFAVVVVLDKDCNISKFWRSVCRDVRGAKVFYNPPPSKFRQILVIRNARMTDEGRVKNLMRAMLDLGEIPDVPEK